MLVFGGCAKSEHGHVTGVVKINGEPAVVGDHRLCLLALMVAWWHLSEESGGSVF